MTRRHRQRSATHAADPSPPPSPLPSPVRGRAPRSSTGGRDDDDDDFSCSMLTDTSTFSSSDGKRAYSTTTTTTTTTRTAKRSLAPSSSASTTASNWSCGWDAPLTSEPTLSSLPTYVFDNTDGDANDDDDKERKRKGDKKASKKKHKKKADGRRERSRPKGARKGRAGGRRRPTDAETDAEAYRMNRASDPWARSVSTAAAIATSSKTDTETYRHDTTRTPLATTASFSDDDDSVETEQRDKRWRARRDAAVDEQTDTHASAPAVWHETSFETSMSPPSSCDDSTDAPSTSISAATTATTTPATTSDGSSATADETSFVSTSSANCDPTVTDDSAPAAERAPEHQAHDDGASDATANDTRFDYNDEDEDDVDSSREAHDDTTTAWESSAGVCNCPRCACAESAADNDGRPDGDDDDERGGTSDSDDDESRERGNHHACHGGAGPCGAAVAPPPPGSARASSSSLLSSSSSSSISSATADDWIDVRVGPKAPCEPPVYIRVCHRGTAHRRGSLCDERPDDDHDDGNDVDSTEGDHEPSSGRAHRDGVIETHSVTIAEPLVRPCEPDAPHAIFGRPCSAHGDRKGRAPRPMAPVVVAPGVRDLPGGVPESFGALGATYTLLAGAVDTRCRIESALVALRARARAQPALVFEAADVNIVGVSGSGTVTINGRTYPLTATASFYVHAGSALAVGNAAGATPLIFVQQFVGAAAGLGFYREVATYEAAVGGAVNVDACVIEAIAARYRIRAALGQSSRRVGAADAFVPPGTVRFLPTPQCEADSDDSASSSSTCTTDTTATGGDDDTACCTACDGNSNDDDLNDDSDDDDSDGSSGGPIDAGVDSWGLRRRQLLVLAAVGGAGPVARPAATVRPTDLDALITLGQSGTRVTVRATVIRDPRSGGCPDALARPTINGAEAITLLTGVAYWTYYDEAADNVIVQCVPGSRLPAVLPPAFGVAPAAGSSVGFADGAPLPPQQGLPPIAVRPAPFV